MVMNYFARPPLARDQILLFRRTLEDSIADDAPVRALDELIDTCDFSKFEQTYHGSRGQPPIPPKVLAKVWIYAQQRKARSSRVVEYLLESNVDFMWLAEGHTPDHVTLCNFRTKFGKHLESLFQQIGALAMTMGLVRLQQVTLDGTRVKANNSRFETLTAPGIEKELQKLGEEMAEFLKESEAADKAEDALFGAGGKEHEVPPELATKKARKEQLKKALPIVRAMDEQRRRTQQIDPAKNPAQLPMTDSDSRVMPNKEGGYAPNYTPLAAVDVQSDFIVAAGVIPEVPEQHKATCMVEQIKDNFGKAPDQLLCDGHFATGSNIAAFENSETELISPLPDPESTQTNPALRADPTQPVPESEWGKLPRNPQHKKLDKSCFVYNAEQDIYNCPMGQPMAFTETKKKPQADGKTLDCRVYRSAACADCPLRNHCVSEKSKEGRTVSHDQFTEHRKRHAEKMKTEAAKTSYKKRLHAGETPFAHIKHHMGLRQFLLRGLEKVNTEWLWACTSYNVMKLMQHVAKLRAAVAAAATAGAE